MLVLIHCPSVRACHGTAPPNRTAKTKHCCRVLNGTLNSSKFALVDDSNPRHYFRPLAFVLSFSLANSVGLGRAKEKRAVLYRIQDGPRIKTMGVFANKYKIETINISLKCLSKKRGQSGSWHLRHAGYQNWMPLRDLLLKTAPTLYVRLNVRYSETLIEAMATVPDFRTP